MAGTSKYGKFKPTRIVELPLSPEVDSETLETSLAEIGVAVIEADADDRVVRLNSVAERITGWRTADAKDKPLSTVFKVVKAPSASNAGDLTGLPDHLALRMRALFSPDRTALVARHDGEVIPVRHSVLTPARKGRAAKHVFFRDLSPEQLLSLQLAGRTDRDALTGLLTRRTFEERVANTPAPRWSHGLCWFDLDRFRLVNVTCGHDAGDELLKWVTTRIHEVLGSKDCAARIGADEFVVLFNDRTENEIEEGVRELQQRLLKTRFTWGDKSFAVPASFGLVSFGHANEHPSELLRAANGACGTAKEHGGGRIHVVWPGDTKAQADRQSMDWVASLQRNLAAGRLKLFAQLLQPLQAKGHVGAHFEVLVRQVGDDGQLHSPVRIIQAAESVGLMDTIDRFVISKTLDVLSEMPRASLKRLDVAAINLSGVSLLGKDLLDFIVGELGRTKVPPRKVCFEITETAALANLDEVLWLMQELRGMGCRFAIDDFGSGHASYAYVERLPVDHVKIDGAFVRDLLDNPLHRAIVESVHLIGRTLNIKTVAESVEVQEVADALAHIGIDAGQGWLFGKPQPLAEVCASL
jgi:diguanylate cyclase (GGDEF)-like protein